MNEPRTIVCPSCKGTCKITVTIKDRHPGTTKQFIRSCPKCYGNGRIEVR